MSTWVFLRGLIREQRHWGNFPAEFQHQVDDADVVTLDLPGNGALYREASPIRIEDMAEFCRRELAARSLPPPYRLLALSLGAMVAVAWCAQYPSEVESCVLINTSLRPFSPFYRRLRPRNYPHLIYSALQGDPHRRERMILQLTSCRPDIHAALADQWTAWQREFPVSRRNALRQLFAASRFRAPREKPPAPILVLGSAQDHLVDAACSRSMATAWQAPSAFHPTAGHDLPLDDGPWVARQVKAWLESTKNHS